jgi:hypothetical protein
LPLKSYEGLTFPLLWIGIIQIPFKFVPEKIKIQQMVILSENFPKYPRGMNQRVNFSLIDQKMPVLGS